MFPNYCGPLGFAGWLLTLLVWSALVSLVVWGITRLFPDSPRVAVTTVADSARGEDAPDVPVESGRR